ncbi:BTAD domain-containing putative transcriptional regulator (plasmid) [Microtetraspora malaysiensis]|uniref:AfsR/SARP family transcriptional regulator n=1 Tax=Microtetraspora malaysiensis TaxID=161358 RepID=UPI003D8A6080
MTTEDGTPLALQPIRAKLLAALLTAGGHGMPVGELLEAVWGEEAGPDHEATLKSTLSVLRRHLGRDRLPLGGRDGYRITLLDGDRFDLEDFRTLADEGSLLFEKGDHEQAADLLRRAISLWGAPVLADLPEESSWMRSIRHELIEERRAAQVLLFCSMLELGEHRPLVRELRRAVADDPLSEDLHVLLMKALWRSGHRIQALQHYEALAERLRADTGADPSYQLRALREEILDDQDGDARQRGRAVWAAPAQLPPDVIDFTGRTEQVRELVAFLTPAAEDSGVRIAGVSGLGGVGKSALAVHVAHRLRHLFPDGQLFIQWEGMSERPREPGDVLADVLASLGVPAASLPAAVGDRTSLLRTLLAERRVLVVLDDVSGANHVHPLLPGTPGCAVIVTSRAHLTGVPGMRRIRLHPLDGGDALSLLGEIIGSERVEAEPGAAAEVVRACDGLPLAVRIAGSRLSAHPNWGLAYFTEQLAEHALKALDAGGGIAVSASIGESYTSLSEATRRAFRVLALAGPGDFPAWLPAMLLGVADADELLDELTVRSLVAPSGSDGQGRPRYRQHDLICAYAAARLVEHVGERDSGVWRLLLGWLELVGHADSYMPPPPWYPPPSPLESSVHSPARVRALIDVDPDGWFSSEIGNMLELVRLACEERRYQSAAGIGLRLESWLYRHRRYRDAEDMWRQIMRAAEEGGDPRWASEARLRMASLVGRQPGGPERALPLLNECVSVFAELVDRPRLARAYGLRSWCARAFAGTQDGDGRDYWLTAALGDARHGLEAARYGQDRYAEIGCLRAAARAAAERGDVESAAEWARDAVKRAGELAAETGQTTYEAWALTGLVDVLMAAGGYGQALDACRRAAGLVAGFGAVTRIAAVAEREGDALAGLGRDGEAAVKYAEAAALCEGDGEPSRLLVRCRAKLAAAAHAGLG